MKEVTLTQLLEAGCHFGHKTNKWNPKAAPYIYKPLGGVHIIDLVKTREALEKAGEFITASVSEGKTVLFVATKRQAHGIVKEKVKGTGGYYLTRRWIGGFLTNWSEIKKNLDKMHELKVKIDSAEYKEKYTKRERLEFAQTIANLELMYGGVAQLQSPPDILVLVDIRKEMAALREALATSKTTVAIVDTNVDPSKIDYPIPANDDAVGSIEIIVGYLAGCIKEGMSLLEKNKVTAEKEKVKQDAKDKKTAEMEEKKRIKRLEKESKAKNIK